MVASSVIGVISQRLVRCLCPACKAAYEASGAEKKMLHVPEDKRVKLYKPVGCPQCLHTGYAGRTAMGEIMVVTPRLRTAINKSVSSDALREIAVGEGMRTIADDARILILEGRTSLAEAAGFVDFT
ncbi:MAG: type II secretion system protein GspE, partial [Ruthenibacterium sp.]